MNNKEVPHEQLLQTCAPTRKSVRSRLLYVSRHTGPSPPPPDYEQAIDDAWDALSAQLDQHIADRHIRDNVRSLILIYTNTIGDAYINLGLKAGARLLQELLHTT